MKFLFVLIILMFLSPFIAKGLLWLLATVARRHIEKKTREMEDAFARAAGIDPQTARAQRREEQRRRAHQQDVDANGGWSEPQPRPKKIDPSTGEYIKYKEIEISTRYDEEAQTIHDPKSGKVKDTFLKYFEEQIVDVTWEDI